MSNILGKLEVKTVREGEGLIPMQLAVPGVTDDDLPAGRVRRTQRHFSYGFL
jgi:hypothetical protein